MERNWKWSQNPLVFTETWLRTENLQAVLNCGLYLSALLSKNYFIISVPYNFLPHKNCGKKLLKIKEEKNSVKDDGQDS